MTDDKLRSAVYTLMKIRKSLMDDNDLSLNVAGCGWYVVVTNIDEIITGMLELTRIQIINTNELNTYKQIARELSNLLGGYDAELLTDERKDALKAMVEKWQKEDEKDD